jgi:hypothetical protein
MILAMAIGAFFCTALGVFPSMLYARLPFPVDFQPYTADHVVSTLELLLGTGLGFWLLISKLGGEATVSIDTDWLYRKPFVPLFNALVTTARRIGSVHERFRMRLLDTLIHYFQNPFLALWRIRLATRLKGNPLSLPLRMDYDENHYRLPIGVTVFWIVVFFACISLYNL